MYIRQNLRETRDSVRRRIRDRLVSVHRWTSPGHSRRQKRTISLPPSLTTLLSNSRWRATGGRINSSSRWVTFEFETRCEVSYSHTLYLSERVIFRVCRLCNDCEPIRKALGSRQHHNVYWDTPYDCELELCPDFNRSSRITTKEKFMVHIQSIIRKNTVQFLEIYRLYREDSIFKQSMCHSVCARLDAITRWDTQRRSQRRWSLVDGMDCHIHSTFALSRCSTARRVLGTN